MSFNQLSHLESQPRASEIYSDDPAFKKLLTDLRNSLFAFQRTCSQLRTDVNLLGTRRDTARLRERVHKLLEKSRDQCKELTDGVKKLQSFEDLSKQQKYEQNKVATQFQDALRDFQGLQRLALEKEKASVTAARAAVEGEGGESSGFTEQQQQLLQQQELVNLAPQDEVDFQEQLIIEREEEIQNIERGVSDINMLFRQVNQIVIEQGESLNTIADNVEQVRDDTRGAMTETAQAARYQKAARNKSCILLLILSVILTIILLAIFLD
ncbi:Syntaxin-12 [Ceratocystis fimbriata CBS 114723]|uniref:Syntaxin-12 n=1 Tax=Ceratocystis fimbriata CBS 114723 TaxID=1035309 RepID=A0A2C5X438_9PEZI|nr:Syntaxin-12 [Ceratocystis fimbriata CBS 114723]